MALHSDETSTPRPRRRYRLGAAALALGAAAWASACEPQPQSPLNSVANPAVLDGIDDAECAAGVAHVVVSLGGTDVAHTVRAPGGSVGGQVLGRGHRPLGGYWTDCEDLSSGPPVVVGCGLVISGVTHGLTGFVPLAGLVRLGSPAPVRPERLA